MNALRRDLNQWLPRISVTKNIIEYSRMQSIFHVIHTSPEKGLSNIAFNAFRFFNYCTPAHVYYHNPSDFWWEWRKRLYSNVFLALGCFALSSVMSWLLRHWIHKNAWSVCCDLNNQSIYKLVNSGSNTSLTYRQNIIFID